MRDVIWRDGTHREEGGIEEDLERMAPVSDLAATRVWLQQVQTRNVNRSVSNCFEPSQTCSFLGIVRPHTREGVRPGST